MNVKKNILYNIAYQLLIMFLPLITTPYISRVIGAEGVGIYSYVFSIVTYFMLFSMLGLNNYGNRSIAAVRNDKVLLSRTFFSIYLLQFVTSVLMILFYIIYIVFFVTENRIIYYIQLIFIISTTFDINWFFFGLEQFKLTVIRNTIIKIITVICIFIFVNDIDDLWIYTLIMALGTLFSQSILWFFIKKYIMWIKPTFREIRAHLKPNLILFIPVISVSIYKIMDKIMLGSIQNAIEVGYYENSEKIIFIPISIISALGTVMLPRMTHLISGGETTTVKNYIEKSMSFVMFIAIGASIGLIGISPRFIPLFLGDEFIECTKIVSLLSITVVFVAWANVIRTQYLIPQKKDSVYIESTVLGAIINFISNIIFIPLYGAIGAAIGTIFAEFFVAIYQTFKVRKEIDIYKYLRGSLLYIIPAICMYACIVSLNNITENIMLTLLIQVIVGGIAYVVLSSIVLWSIDKDVRIKFKQLLYKGRKI